MKRKAGIGLMIFCAAIAIGCAQAQTELSIGEIDIPSFSWGRQKATFEVTNNSDWMKYITVETEISFEGGTYLNPSRVVSRHYPLVPGETLELTPEIDVPGNYGRATLYVRLYDVVDTLDQILAGQKVFEQPFQLTFHIPDDAAGYFQEKITFPPMVSNSLTWDNEFAHMLPIMLKEGKSLEQIAAINMADTGFVRQTVDLMIEERFLQRQTDGSISPTFPVILLDQAEQTKTVVERFSDQLADLIEGNMNGYQMVLDSLVKAGSLTTDSNEFMHGGSILYVRYPVISTLLLWYDLGSRFIADGAPLTVFAGTNPCHSLIGKYMYVVQGGDVFNGHHYFHLDQLRPASRMIATFTDSIPKITCPRDLSLKRRLRERADYNYVGDAPESFIVSRDLVKPALTALGKGTDDLFQSATMELTAISAAHGHQEVTVGERYWFWNMLASRTLDKLVKDGALVRRGNGRFKLTSTE